MQVALYARVSTSSQEKADTIESQVELLQAYTQAQGYDVLPEHIFLDNGVSGSRLDRPELDRLRDCVQMGDVDAVVVLSPDRFARSYAHQWLLLEEFKKYHCQVMFVQTPFSDTPQGHLLLQVQGMIAEYEREQIRERTRRGRLAKARKGAFIPWAYKAYGLRYIPKQPGRSPQVEIEPGEAEVVRQMFGWLIEEQMTSRQIAKRLNERQIPTKTGKNSVWQPATVTGILSNSLYAGRAYCNKHYPNKRLRPRSTWIEVKAPAIISEETFEKAHLQLVENRRQAERFYRRASHRYLLRTRVCCGICGLQMCGRHQQSSAKRDYLYYVCNGQHPLTVGRVHRCTSRHVRADRLDALVWTALCELLQQPEALYQEYQLYRDLLQGDQTQFQAQFKRLDIQIQRVQRQIQRLIDAYQNEIIELDELDKRKQQLLGQQTALEKQYQQLQFQQRRSLRWEKVVEDIQEFRQLLSHRLDRLSFEERQKLVQLLIEKVVVFPNGEVEIHHLLPTGATTPGSNNGKPKRPKPGPTEDAHFYRLRLGDRGKESPAQAPRAA